MQIGVLGAGSWGTALAKVLADGGHQVTLWARNADMAAAIQEARENAAYLPGARLPDSLTATGDLGKAVADKLMVVSVVPSQATRAVLREAPIGAGTLLVGASKGIENETLATMDEVFAAVAPQARAVFLSGPSF